MEKAFCPGEEGLFYVHLHPVVAQFVQVDVAYFIVFTNDPEAIVFVQVEISNVVVGDRGGVVLFMTKEEETLTIVPFKPTHSSDPYISLRVLSYSHGDIGGQAVAYTQVGEEVLLLGGEV